MPGGSSRFAVAVHVLTLRAAAGDEPLKSEFVASSVNTNAVVIRRLRTGHARHGSSGRHQQRARRRREAHETRAPHARRRRTLRGFHEVKAEELYDS